MKRPILPNAYRLWPPCSTGDSASWLDADDDGVDPPEREKLRELLHGLPGGMDGRQGVPVGLARTLDPP